MTARYTVRRLGETAWWSGDDRAEALFERDRANEIIDGHVVIVETDEPVVDGRKDEE